MHMHWIPSLKPVLSLPLSSYLPPSLSPTLPPSLPLSILVSLPFLPLSPDTLHACCTLHVYTQMHMPCEFHVHTLVYKNVHRCSL